VQLRPIHHEIEDRVSPPVLICVLAGDLAGHPAVPTSPDAAPPDAEAST